MSKPLKQRLQSAENRARAARARHKKVLRAVKQVRALDAELGSIRKDPGALNVELAYDGDIVCDFDLEDYPELVEDTLALCEKLRQVALHRVDESVES